MPLRLLVLLFAAALVGCGGASVVSSGGNANGAPASPGGSSGTGGGGGNNPSGGGGSSGGTPLTKANACHTERRETAVQPAKRPVDVILIIDNSGSMTTEIQAVENNVNTNFAQILQQSGVDYRVILLAKHGTASLGQSICIRSPLSGTTCSPVPPAPVNGARFFHYDTEIGSTDSLQKILSTYAVTDVNGFAPGGWRTWLRPDSFKSVIEITDDETEITADAFEASLFANAGTDFGTASNRRYVFHSIIGIVPNNPASAPWLPTDGKKSADCPTAAAAGAHYEDLSIRTGGLRFPVCETSSYDAVFQAAAQGVIASANIGCEFIPPAPPSGQIYLDAFVEYTASSGAVERLRPMVTATCDSQSFQMSPITGRIQLCPEACAKIQADTAAKLEVVYGCGVAIN